MKKNKKAYKKPLLKIASLDEIEFIAQSFGVRDEEVETDPDDETIGTQW